MTEKFAIAIVVDILFAERSSEVKRLERKARPERIAQKTFK